MIDIEHERLIPIGEAHKHIPGRPHLSAVYRWMNRTNNALETVKVGGKRFTSHEAIVRFAAACTGGSQAPSSPLSAARAQQIAAAERRLDARGVK